MLQTVLTKTVALFFVVDPMAALPLFLAMTASDSDAWRRTMASRACAILFGVMAAFALFGNVLFRWLNISLESFEIAGGALLFLLGVDMLRAQPSRERITPAEREEARERTDVSVFPLAIPMLAGPGAITTVLVWSTQKTAQGVAEVLLAVALTSLATWLILRSASALKSRLRQTGLNILQRVMGLVVAAIAVQFIVDGARGAFRTYPQ